MKRWCLLLLMVGCFIGLARGLFAIEKFGGLGLMVAQLYNSEEKNQIGSLVVLDVIKGMPAETQGVQRGDVITHIDHEPTAGKIFKDLILGKLRGPIGSLAELTIERAGVKEPITITIQRVEIVYPLQEKKD